MVSAEACESEDLSDPGSSIVEGAPEQQFHLAPRGARRTGRPTRVSSCFAALTRSVSTGLVASSFGSTWDPRGFLSEE